MTISQLLPGLQFNLRRAGWAMAARGVLAVIFGLIALRSPDAAATAFVIMFAIYAFADGLLSLVLAAGLARARERWGWYVVEGIASIALGVVAVAYPSVTLLAVVVLVGLRAIVLGISELGAAIAWEELDSRWLLGVTGAVSVILGVLLFASPGEGALVLIWSVGVYAIVFGVMLVALGLRVARIGGRTARLRGTSDSAF